MIRCELDTGITSVSTPTENSLGIGVAYTESTPLIVLLQLFSWQQHERERKGVSLRSLLLASLDQCNTDAIQ